MNDEQKQQIMAAVKQILVAVGEDPERAGLLETPERVARMYDEIFSTLREPEFTNYKLFQTDSHAEMVVVKDIPFYSMCEHHLLPFFGTAHIAYLPAGGQIIGLSKIARLVDYVAHKPNVQERLTSQLVDELQRILQPKGIAVELEARHMCMEMRGIQKTGSQTVTTRFTGDLNDPVRIAEFERRLC
ncbi:GTP cyclohydrolase I FolE [Loigolactobacillus jiayinensis]|uniref:GTP cyclohydrolase 1 n=1 Tax=Loigolactobacillus jiayinensis TaxID=2486016 RepID=A0ABW1RHP0_9LACO|nr:GTP cyclohydrolase I FolE [Loigolactobacillus jiayinensis]